MQFEGHVLPIVCGRNLLIFKFRADFLNFTGRANYFSIGNGRAVHTDVDAI